MYLARDGFEYAGKKMSVRDIRQREPKGNKLLFYSYINVIPFQVTVSDSMKILAALGSTCLFLHGKTSIEMSFFLKQHLNPARWHATRKEAQQSILNRSCLILLLWVKKRSNKASLMKALSQSHNATSASVLEVILVFLELSFDGRDEALFPPFLFCHSF